MFFIGIFGVDNKVEEIKNTLNINCNHCDKQSLSLLKTYNRFHFFFIPLFKWKIKYYIKCNSCDSVYEISNEKGEKIEKEGYDLNYWDMKNAHEVYVSQEIVCSQCNNVIDKKFKYCPNCGTRTNK